MKKRPDSDTRVGDFRFSAVQLLAATLSMLPMSLWFGLWSVRMMGNGVWLGAVTLLFVALGFSWLYWRMVCTHVRFDGPSFSCCGVTQRHIEAHAADFIGFELDMTWHRWTLLRRADLGRVHVPWLASAGTPTTGHPIHDWLHEYFAPAMVQGARLVAKQGPAMAQQRTLRSLRQTLSADSEDLSLPGRVEVELSTAAYAAGLHRYDDAVPDLERLLLELPPLSRSRQYVIAALRVLADRRRLPAFERALDSAACRYFRAQIAELVCHLATSDERALIERLRHDKDPFVRRTATTCSVHHVEGEGPLHE